LDFVIDGRSLKDRICVGDRVTPLGSWFPVPDQGFVEQLLGLRQGDSPSGRVPLYVCSECGDLGCGAITAVVERTDDTVVWRNFAYENNYDPEMTEVDAFRGVGPFVFSAAHYSQVFLELPR
jgi:hypothetical protein